MYISRVKAASIIKLVTLDVTNTLIRVAGSPGHQYAIIGCRHGIFLDDNLLTGLFLKYYREYTNKYPNFGTRCSMSAHTWWGMLVKDCFTAADPSLPEHTLNLLADELYVHYTTPAAWDFLPGAFEAIKDLRQYPVKIGVISNWDHRLFQVLSNLKLQPFFDFILPSTVVGVEKPDPDIFRLALKKADCLPNEAIHFGDSVEKDFKGANDVGMTAYLLATPGIKYSNLDQTRVVSSVQAFVDLIRPHLGVKSSQSLALLH